MSKTLSGIREGFEPFVIHDFLSNHPSMVWIAPSEDEAAKIYDRIQFLYPLIPLHLYPSWDCLPYDRGSPSSQVMAKRLSILKELLKPVESSRLIITNLCAISQKVPPRSSQAGHSFSFFKNQQKCREHLLNTLANLGYKRVDTAYEPGDYAVRGGLIDLFPVGSETPFRLDFFGEDLETIKSFDSLSQKSQEEVNGFTLATVGEVLLSPETITQFRTRYRELFQTTQDPLYQSISEKRPYPGMEHWLPLFYDKVETFFDYVPSETILFFPQETKNIMEEYGATLNESYQSRLNPLFHQGQTYRALPPGDLYLSFDDLENDTKKFDVYTIAALSQTTSFKDYQNKLAPEFATTRSRVDINLFDHVVHTLKKSKEDFPNRQISIACRSEGVAHRLHHVLSEHGLLDLHIMNSGEFDKFPFELWVYPLDTGFQTSNRLLLTDYGILGERWQQGAKKKQKSADRFFQEANQLLSGDIVVHTQHGIGRYDGLNTLCVDHIPHDCLTLIYADGDKLFLPVENMDMITRFGSDQEYISLDKLGSTAWQVRKAKVKKRLSVVASYLIDLAAQRSLKEGAVFETPEGMYEEFCARFPYVETEDQLSAIQETLEDFTTGKPMDRLVCGDVGFGKTEIALRAAFITATNGKQTAIVVPTTLLCRQHFETFSRRFLGFPYKVGHLSRFATKREIEKTLIGLKDGSIHTVIATSSIFSNRVQFHDLGLLIIDEEQHFGVKQKEKLKTLKSDVHVLTLTATPIPRTLQLSLAGVRELSLITTPPLERLSVRTFIMPFDAVVIREAILREYHRGGQVFYVCPRIQDLADIFENTVSLVPEVKIRLVHSQLPTKEIEDIMDDFYDRKFDVLLSTNIVESGIDISNANTLIVHRSDRFGLAQLYQLRGRVGRSRTQGYAYLTTVQGQSLTKEAEKRLYVMQTLEHLGAGFNLASYDLDIRGAGNIVGEEQSGHIKEVGVELYQHLLEEAIEQAKLTLAHGNSETPLDESEFTPQLNIGVPVLIPEDYVPDLGVRLSLYKRLSAIKQADEIQSFASELIDRFGPLPKEVQNLLTIIEIKGLCLKSGIEKIDAGPKGIVVSLYKNTFRYPEKLLAYLQNQKGKVKLRPDQKIVFTLATESSDKRLALSRTLCQHLAKLAS